LIEVSSCKNTGGGQNNGNTKKLRNRIYVGYIERTLVGNTECSSSVCLHSVVFKEFTFGEHAKEACNPECLVPTVKHGGGFVKV
jgi:hypothetical protein